MNLKRISVKLSWMLRHCQTPRYIDLNGGWADVEVIIKALKERYPDFDRKTLELIVAQDEKGGMDAQSMFSITTKSSLSSIL